ncbi:MAG: 50S ribosomal protein L35 [Candidatus Levybacteria bacterium]|nr:50S ribosomal protein L35 [Candidatus Levybacteria bacterium]
MSNKLRVKKSISKRFRVTKTGKVMRGKQNTSHLKKNKSQNQIRRGKEPAQLEGLFARKIKKLLAQ